VNDLLGWLDLPVSVIIRCVELWWPVSVAKQRNIFGGCVLDYVGFDLLNAISLQCVYTTPEFVGYCS
ncbi:hypothetical protein S245_020042, partial [Arachis hypogaea]